MQIAIRHAIELNIGAGVPRGVQHLLLTPQSTIAQTVREWSIEAEGLDDPGGFIDACGNRAHLSSQTRPEPTMTVVASGIVETEDRSGVVGRLERDPVPALFRRVTPLTRPLPSVVSRFKAAPRDGKDRIALLHALMARIGEVTGDGATQSQSQSQSQGGQGQAQPQAPRPATAADQAHAFIGAARALQIPARFVTGYVLPDAGDAIAGFHCWAEAWDEGLGWIGFDAALNLCPTERHVRLACGLDAASTVPLRSVPAAAPPDFTGAAVTASQVRLST